MDYAELLRRRRMVRAFETRPIPPATLACILAAARRAPSAGNTDALDLVVLEGEGATARYWDVTLPPPARDTFRWPGLLRAPVLVIPCVSATAYVERYDEDDKRSSGLGRSMDAWPVPYWHVDGGMSVMAMLLAANDAGLGALFFGLFAHERAVTEAFSIPATHQPIGTIAVGYPAADEPGRSAARPTRASGEAVHFGGW